MVFSLYTYLLWLGDHHHWYPFLWILTLRFITSLLHQILMCLPFEFKCPVNFRGSLTGCGHICEEQSWCWCGGLKVQLWLLVGEKV